MFTALLLAGGVAAQDRAEPRVTLVIGNSSYAVGPLKNPVNDADDMARMLRTLGFSVTLRQNATHRQMIEAIGDLGRQLKAGGVGLVPFRRPRGAEPGSELLDPREHGHQQRTSARVRRRSTRTVCSR